MVLVGVQSTRYWNDVDVVIAAFPVLPVLPVVLIVSNAVRRVGWHLNRIKIFGSIDA